MPNRKDTETHHWAVETHLLYLMQIDEIFYPFTGQCEESAMAGTKLADLPLQITPCKEDDKNDTNNKNRHFGLHCQYNDCSLYFHIHSSSSSTDASVVYFCW